MSYEDYCKIEGARILNAAELEQFLKAEERK